MIKDVVADIPSFDLLKRQQNIQEFVQEKIKRIKNVNKLCWH